MLIALRIIGLAVVIALAFTMVAWLVTRERRWLRIAWLIFKYAVFGMAFVLLLFALLLLLPSYRFLIVQVILKDSAKLHDRGIDKYLPILWNNNL